MMSQLNPGIILGGQQTPSVMDRYMQMSALASQVQKQRRGAALSALANQHAVGAMQGDEAALEAYARAGLGQEGHELRQSALQSGKLEADMASSQQKQMIEQAAQLASLTRGLDKDPTQLEARKRFAINVMGMDPERVNAITPEDIPRLQQAAMTMAQHISTEQDARDFERRVKENDRAFELDEEKFLLAQQRTMDPKSTIGRLQSDFDQGLIDEETYRAAMDKATSRGGEEIRFDPSTGQFMIRRGGAISGDGASMPAFGTTAQNEIDKKSIDIVNRLSRLQAISEYIKPEHLTIVGQWDAEWAKFRDRVPQVFGQLDPDEKKMLEDYTIARSAAFEDLNQTILEMSGAAVSAEEANRQLEVLADPNTDSPTTFDAKVQRLTKQQRWALYRYSYWRATGGQGDPWDLVGINGVPQLMKREARNLSEQYLANGDARNKKEADDRAIKEIQRLFGVGG